MALAYFKYHNLWKKLIISGVLSLDGVYLFLKISMVFHNIFIFTYTSVMVKSGVHICCDSK